MTDRIRKIEIRKLTSADHDQVTALAAKVSEHDLLFLARDLTHPKVIEAWMTEIGEGSIHSLAAFLDGKLVGYTALLTDPHSWSSHVGEIRVLVDSSCRGQGVGASLLIKTFQHALSLGLEKMIARMTTDQHGAIALFEGFGFRAEAILQDHVCARDGTKHDLAILSHDVEAAAARHAALHVGQDGEQG